MSKQPETITAFGVIPVHVRDDGVREYLIIQNHTNHWGFPKGLSEAGELPEQVAVRELQEETGIRVSVDALGERFDYTYPIVWKGKAYNKQLGLFAALVPRQEIELQATELKDYKWLELAGVAEHLIPEFGEIMQRVGHASLTGFPLQQK